jgi:serine/tyrosine/threonine adenylyltransferase
MGTQPFEAWGAEGTEDDANLDQETKAERRLCGLGEKKMLGFQCSCSS